ncbi:MAG: 4Fe-4S double cluster binding domain-containing protein [Termitinemataceae bacterium]
MLYIIGKMLASSIVEYIRNSCATLGFSRVRILSPYNPKVILKEYLEDCDLERNYWEGAESLLVAAMPYGNQGVSLKEGQPDTVAPFARRNYYAEAVSRFQQLAQNLRQRWGGSRSDYRILCNSPVPEKPLALISGLGWQGKHSLVITPEAGSLIIIAAMTLPVTVPGDPPLPGIFPVETDPLRQPVALKRPVGYPACRICGDQPRCAKACPTGALDGMGGFKKERCIQWYASGNGDGVPSDIAEVWGNRVYGCTLCQDACPYNDRPIVGMVTDRGKLPDYFSPLWIQGATNDALQDAVQGTALGMKWLGVSVLRRNAELALAWNTKNTRGL